MTLRRHDAVCEVRRSDNEDASTDWAPANLRWAVG